MSTTVPAVSQTLKNLLAAFEGERNAATRYLAFALKAEEEGYLRAGTLFRAAARAEQIHAANHAQIINKLGGKPECKIEPPKVGTTAENLKAAKEGEEYERDVMYPGFIQEAEMSHQPAAVRTFRNAMEAEAVHAELYGAALANLEKQKAPTTFYVCPYCGNVMEEPAQERCSICHAPQEKFEVFKS